MKKSLSRLLSFVLSIILLTGCVNFNTENEVSSLYSSPENWAYSETDRSASADVFFLCPTVYRGQTDTYNMSLDDTETKADFFGAINMEKGIYDKNCRFFAPYYRQAGLNVYELPETQREKYLSLAYSDIKEAFQYYMEHFNNGQPIILAGFSQGADLCIRLLKDCFSDDKTNDLLVACYAIGWRITEEETDEFPHLSFAAGEDDTGVIISFNSEAEFITDSLLVPEETHTLCINPLNWKTDGTPAKKEENLGACFTDYDGNITSEIPELTGAYIDSTRGTLKVPDVSPADYPPVLSIFQEGVYHLYDYQFFYRNLQENVDVRINSYMQDTGKETSASAGR